MRLKGTGEEILTNRVAGASLCLLTPAELSLSGLGAPVLAGVQLSVWDLSLSSLLPVVQAPASPLGCFRSSLGDLPSRGPLDSRSRPRGGQ